MIPRITRFLHSLLYDESASQRYMAVTCFFIGKTLTTGGVIPVVEVAIPGLDYFYRFGPLFMAAAFFLGAGTLTIPPKIDEPVQGKTVPGVPDGK